MTEVRSILRGIRTSSRRPFEAFYVGVPRPVSATFDRVRAPDAPAPMPLPASVPL